MFTFTRPFYYLLHPATRYLTDPPAPPAPPHAQAAETVYDGGTTDGTANRPGEKVRRQTRNIASVLRAAAWRGKFFLFLEDDMLLCPQVAVMTLSSAFTVGRRGMRVGIPTPAIWVASRISK